VDETALRRILLFGGAGFVGGNLAAVALRGGWSVCVADQAAGLGLDGVDERKVDVSAPDSVDEVIGDFSPSAVVNMAAIASIDAAERDQELARKVNVEGARNVAQSCARRNLRHIFFSSDAVYSGSADAYSEQDTPDPVNYYGRTKAAAERAVLSTHRGAVIVRLSLVLGFPVVRGNSFLASLQGKLAAGHTVPCPLDEVRTPVDVITLSECVLELAQREVAGVFHIGGTESINRYDLAVMLARKMGLEEAGLVPFGPEARVVGRAPRHKNGVLSVAKAQRLLRTEMLDLDATIDRALRERITDERSARDSA
jgi:dTDP-4-dehydrorhamnose reductase